MENFAKQKFRPTLRKICKKKNSTLVENQIRRKICEILAENPKGRYGKLFEIQVRRRNIKRMFEKLVEIMSFDTIL